MRFDGYYCNPGYNWRYANYIRFYPEGFLVVDQLELKPPPPTEMIVKRLRFTHPSGQLQRGRWRLVEGRLEAEVVLLDDAVYPPPPGRRAVPREGISLFVGPDGTDRLELDSRSDHHPEWAPDEKHEVFTFTPCPMVEESGLSEERFLLPRAARVNPADGAELVEVDGLWVYRFPVTVGQYRKHFHLPDRPKFGWQNHDPMVRVTFAEASAYALKVGARLPSEAEWIQAASGRAYPWGDEPDATRLQLGKATTWVTRHPDGMSSCGALDMAGNAAEWCTDLVKGKRVVKGGSYRSKSVEACRCDARELVAEDRCHPWLGFRCVLLSS